MTIARGRTDEPYLHVSEPRRAVTAVALLLHGGRSQSTDSVPPWSTASLRMLPFARALRRAGGRHGLVVARIRYQQRGWNGSAQSPVPDARSALAELGRRFPDRPIGLVGHSMGGRTAFYVADDPAVRAVVGLAPWIENGDPVAPLRDRQVLIAHGDGDRMTSPRASAAFAARLQGVARTASYVTVHGEKHAMLHRPGVWHDLAAGYTVGALFGKNYVGTADPVIANVIAEALDGSPSLAL
jgi:dienelactone hydrolase